MAATAPSARKDALPLLPKTNNILFTRALQSISFTLVRSLGMPRLSAVHGRDDTKSIDKAMKSRVEAEARRGRQEACIGSGRRQELEISTCARLCTKARTAASR